MKRTTHINPTWCPGCGNFGILGGIKIALDKLKLEPHQFTTVYDVGCSGNMADFVYSYGFHSLHGRALPTAAGVKLDLDAVIIIDMPIDALHFHNPLIFFEFRGNKEIKVSIVVCYFEGRC